MQSPTPVTIVSGYLGAGKTTLLNYVLGATEGRPIAVLVNDFGELNIDASLIASHEGETYTLTNGCVCCSIASSFAETLYELAQHQTQFEEVIVEASGVAQPDKIATAVYQYRQFILAGTLVLLDATTIVAQSRDQFIGPLIKDQLAQADLLIINKTDLCTVTQLDELEKWLDQHDTKQPRIRTTFGNIAAAAFFAEREPRKSQAPSFDADHASQFYSAATSSRFDLTRAAFLIGLEQATAFLIRAKGCVQFADGSYAQLQVVGNRQTIEACAPAELGCIFIGRRADRDAIDALITGLTAHR